MHLLAACCLLLTPGSTLAPRPVADLWTGLRAVVAQLEASPQMQAQWRTFAREEGLSEAAWADYVRVRVAFETTRDGGLWGLRWAITNRAPDSEAIWGQLAATRPPEPGEAAGVTAVAECDELSAFFSMVAWKLGVQQTGLFWPTSNHTVAVWTAPTATGTARIVVPTSQIFLDGAQTLGTDAFDPYTQRTIYPYHGEGDVSDQLRLPAGLVEWMLDQAPRAALDPAVLQEERNRRAAR